MSGLRIDVLGELRVSRGGDPLVLPPSRKTRALLAYLAVMGRPQRRERLCELFWDVPDDPRGALRWSLSKARIILNEDGRERLAADRNSVHLDVSDIDFDFALVTCVRPDEVNELETHRLQALAERFRGGFLEDLQLPRCPEFEAWRVYHANEMDVLQLRILRTLVDRLADEPEKALPHLHALRNLDPDDPALAGRAEALAEAARQNVRIPAQPRLPGPSPVPVAAPSLSDDGTQPPEPTVRADGPAEEQSVRFCTARDGVRLAYASSGEGPPILRAAHWMSHLQHDWRSPVWRHWIQELSRHNRLIRYDERCNGMSDWTADDVSFETMVSDLETIVEANRLDRFTLLGISQSCAVSVAYAIRHPERVSGLILFGGYVKGWRKRGDPSEIATREALATLMRVGWGQDNPIFRQLFTSQFIPGASPEQIASFDELQRITVSPENAWRLQNMFGNIDVSDLLEKVAVPTLVLHGRGDRIAPFESGRTFATTIPGARLVELDTGNHVLLRDEPAFDVFLREVRAFASTPPAEPQRPAVAEPAAPVTLAEGRRQMTVLTCEMINPLSFLDYTDPEEEGEDFEAIRELALQVIAGHDGVVVDASHNEFTAAFGAGQASEDHALQACRAALELAAMAEATAEGAMRARIGIDTGEGVVRTTKYGTEVSGAPVTVSRRLVHAVQRGIIATTGRARDAAGGYVEMVRLGRDEAPSFPPDWRVFELVGERKAVSRWQMRADQAETRLIARETELDVLAEAARKARMGQGQVVALIAEAGLGKSRGTHEFLTSGEAKGFRTVECGALELDSAISWALVKNLVRSFFGIEPDESPANAEAKVRDALTTTASDLAAPLLFVLDLPVEDAEWDALSAPGKARRLQDAVVQALSVTARGTPLALLLEDLHWADEQSLEVLRRVVETTRDEPILTIATSRPEGCPRWLVSPSTWQIRLAPLGPSATLDFIQSVLGTDESVAELARVIAERTGGIPLFIEQVVRELGQSGRLAGERGDYRLSGEVGEIAVPATVQSVIAARVGKLNLQDRATLQAAAVIGREIRGGLIQSIAELSESEVDESLARLQAAGFLVQQRSAPPHLHAFRHALIEEVVYGGILGKTRRKLHKRIVEAMERDTPGDDAIERIAEHAIRAELWETAAHYLLRAARKALLRSAHGPALSMVERGMGALGHLPETAGRHRLELQFQKSSGLAWMAARGWGSPEVGKACARAEELCDLLEDRSELFVVLRGRAQYYMIGGQPEAAQAVARRCQALSADTRDEGLQIETHHMVWTNGFFMGDYDATLESAGQARRAYRAEDHHSLTFQYSGHDPGVCCRCFAGMASWMRGRSEEATRECREAVSLAERLAHPLSTALAYWGLGYLHLFRSEPEAVLACAGREIEICDAYMLPLIRSQARFQQGWALAALGDLDDGIAGMTEGVDSIRATGAEMGLPYLLALLGQAWGKRGDERRALGLLDEALASARRNGARFQFSEILRLKAEVLTRTGGDPAEVEALLRSALRSAGRQQAVVAEHRAATDLARLLASERREAESRDLLAPYDLAMRPINDPAEA